MSASEPVSDPELLLEHLDWVRDLARRLVRDESAADDLSQEAWLTAQREIPSNLRSIRGWLGRVVRNLALQEGRREARRRELERWAAKPERLPATVDAVAEVSLQKHVVEAVLELREPYRRTLLARYYERLSPKEIALQEGVTPAAVKARLHRGLSELRARLEGRERRDLAAWLAPLLVPRRPAAAGAALSARFVIPAAAAGFVLLVVAGVQLLRGSEAPREARPFLEHATASSEPAVRVASAAEPAGREPLVEAAAQVATTDAPASEAPGHTVHVSAVDPSGRGLGGVSLSWRTRETTHELGETDSDGTLRVRAPETRARLGTADERYLTVYEPYVRPDEQEERRLVLAPRRILRGIVHDTSGRDVEGAKVTFEVPEETWRGWTGVSGRGEVRSYTTRALAGGRFWLEAPAVPGRVVVGSYGHHVLRREVAAAEPELDLLLHPLGRDRRVIFGSITDADGIPRADAFVSAGGRAVSTDGCGRYQLSLDPDGGPVELVAAAPGRAPRRFLYEAPYTGRVDFELGGAAARITGTVLDHDGAPLSGALVRPASPEPFGERLRTAGGVEKYVPVSLEQVLKGGGTSWVRADADGRFVLGGLVERDYTLVVLDPRTQRLVRFGPLPAGASDKRLHFGAPPAERLSGRIVDDAGEPVAGARLRVGRSCPCHGLDPTTFGPFLETAADGTFDLGPVERQHAVVEVRGPQGHVHLRRHVPRGGELSLTLPRRAGLQLTLEDASYADRFAVEDGAGERVFLMRFRGLDARLFVSADFDREGGAPLYQVPCTARFVVLYRGDELVDRIPIELTAGTTERVRLAGSR